MTIKVKDLVNDDATLISCRCWTDPHVYELEKKGIFGKAWLFLGHESQIKNPGDFVQAYMCETPIILARGTDKKVYANPGFAGTSCDFGMHAEASVLCPVWS